MLKDLLDPVDISVEESENFNFSLVSYPNGKRREWKTYIDRATAQENLERHRPEITRRHNQMIRTNESFGLIGKEIEEFNAKKRR